MQCQLIILKSIIIDTSKIVCQNNEMWVFVISQCHKCYCSCNFHINYYSFFNNLHGEPRNVGSRIGMGKITKQCNRLYYKLLCPKNEIDYI